MALLAVIINFLNAPQVSPDLGVQITINGTYSVTSADSNIDSQSASLRLQSQGSDQGYPYPIQLNANNTWQA